MPITTYNLYYGKRSIVLELFFDKIVPCRFCIVYFGLLRPCTLQTAAKFLKEKYFDNVYLVEGTYANRLHVREQFGYNILRKE